jgi:hypothetical protein
MGSRRMYEDKPFEFKQIFRWEMWGILFITLFGSFLHFTFELSGGWKPLGIISAVNESVWEHLKLAFWPAVIYTILELIFLRRKGVPGRNFWLAKAIGTYLMPVIIVINFYSYTAFTGESILAVDISSFVIAVIAGQVVSYYLIRNLRLPNSFNWLGLSMFVIGMILLGIFTYYPPHSGIFRDPVEGIYGIK